MRYVLGSVAGLGFLALPAIAAALATTGASDRAETPKSPSTASVTAPGTTSTGRRESRRGGSAAPKEVPSPVDRKLWEAARTTYERPDDAAAHARYAILLEQKAREVGNAAFHRMAEKAARTALEKDPKQELARAALGVALLGQHRFAEGLDFVQAVPGRTVWRLASIVDALYELGRYDEAAARAQDLMDLKPGVESYPRAALVRDVMGDATGAVDAWNMAISANPPGTPGFAWASSQLGDLQVRRGRFAEAKLAYEAATEAFPEFFLARAGLARCAVAAGDLEGAAKILRALAQSHGDVPTFSLLGDIEAELGHAKAAELAYAGALSAEATSAAAGIADDRALAIFLADHDQEPERAVALATGELERRPTVASEDALAWALLKAKRPQEALEHSVRARRFGTPSAIFLYHAGAIELELGQREEGAAHLRASLDGGLAADLLQSKHARALLGTGSK